MTETLCAAARRAGDGRFTHFILQINGLSTHACLKSLRFMRKAWIIRITRHLWVSQADKYVDDGILFGRYRKGRVTK